MNTAKEWKTGDGQVLTRNDVVRICELALSGMTTEEIGQQYGRTSGWAWSVLNNEQWVFGRRRDGSRGWSPPVGDAELLANVLEEDGDDPLWKQVEEAHALVSAAFIQIEEWKCRNAESETKAQAQVAEAEAKAQAYRETIKGLNRDLLAAHEDLARVSKELEMYQAAAREETRRERRLSFRRLLQQDADKLRRSLKQ